jgi:uncharacterized protein GlcG (DUF336 family)
MPAINLETAKAIIDAAFADAAQRGMKGMSVVITDTGGNIRAANRSDGAGGFGVDIALTKARTAVGFNNATINIAKVFGENPAAVTGLSAATGGRFIPLGGGIIVTSADGEVIGGAAFAGGAPQIDHEIIVAAVKAAGLNTPE